MASKQQDYYRDFADKLIERIREGTAPWQKPWKPGESALPENMASARKYTGGNTLYLAMAADARGYSDNRWGTYRQIKALGGQVRKGETGEHVVFFARQKRLAQRDKNGKVRQNKDGNTLYRSAKLDRPVWRTFVVFNAEQARGLKLPKRGDVQEPAWLQQKRAEAVIAKSGVDVRHQQGDRAFYHLTNDRVTLPKRGQFPSADNYYQVALHELGHATGHESRLNRDTLKEGVAGGFSSEPYAREELRAEISAMMMGDRLRTGHDPRPRRRLRRGLGIRSRGGPSRDSPRGRRGAANVQLPPRPRPSAHQGDRAGPRDGERPGADAKPLPRTRSRSGRPGCRTATARPRTGRCRG